MAFHRPDCFAAELKRTGRLAADLTPGPGSGMGAGFPHRQPMRGQLDGEA